MKRSIALSLAAAAALACFASAAADDKKKKKEPTVAEKLEWQFSDNLANPELRPTFAFSLSGAWADPPEGVMGTDFELGFGTMPGKTTVAIAADGKAAWIAADLGTYEPCGDETCPKHPKPDSLYHGSILFDGKAGDWTPIAWHVASPTTAREQAAAVTKPVAIDRKVRKGAEEAVALFEKTIGEPKALAASVSKRTDVVLYGSEMKERYVGGKKVAATLTKWNLGFKVRDGIQAGVTSSGSVAWVAANLDAVSLKKVGSKPTAYRALFLYEKYDGAWTLVQIHFSFYGY